MGELIDRILRNLSPEVIEHLNQLPNEFGSEKDIETAKRLFGKLDDVQASQMKEEVQTRLRFERKESQMYDKLAKQAKHELDLAGQLENILQPVGQLTEIEKQLKSYKDFVSKFIYE